jgi:hypothetical protein
VYEKPPYARASMPITMSAIPRICVAFIEPPQTTRRPWITPINRKITARTSRTCKTPPAVYEVTNPSSQSTKSTSAMVINMR